MAQNFKELQAKMDPTIRANNQQRVRDELGRIALNEPRASRS
jgi:hypothetical protein